MIASAHPCPMLPVFEAVSSRTYSDHVPLAPTPLKADRFVTYGPLGAGPGNKSVFVSKFVGL